MDKQQLEEALECAPDNSFCGLTTNDAKIIYDAAQAYLKALPILEQIDKAGDLATQGEWKSEWSIDKQGYIQNELWIITNGQPTAYGFDDPDDCDFITTVANLRGDIKEVLGE